MPRRFEGMNELVWPLVRPRQRRMPPSTFGALWCTEVGRLLPFKTSERESHLVLIALPPALLGSGMVSPSLLLVAVPPSAPLTRSSIGSLGPRLLVLWFTETSIPSSWLAFLLSDANLRFWSGTLGRLTGLPRGDGAKVPGGHSFGWHGDLARCFSLKTCEWLSFSLSVSAIFYPVTKVSTGVLVGYTYKKALVEGGSSEGPSMIKSVNRQ